MRRLIALGSCVGTLWVANLAVRAAPQAAAGRALTIEDYYRVQTVGNPSISPNGKWVSFTVATRTEDSNTGNKTEAFIVATDAASAPRKIVHEGKEVSGLRWNDDGALQYGVDAQQWKIDPEHPSAPPVAVQGRAANAGRGGGRGRGAAPGGRGGAAGVLSPDGAWIAEARDKDQPKPAPAYASDFEKRHEERFKGVTFDWKDFQRDGSPFPVPDPHARPPMRIEIAPAAGGEPNVIDLDLRPDGLSWHPSGKLLAFAADSHWREELAYERPDVWTVTSDGKVTRLTDDGHVHSDVQFSPDGKYLSYARTFGTDMIIKQKLNHGGPHDLYVRPVVGGEPINLTAKWDLEPGAAHWSPDSAFIYYSAEIGGENHLFRASVPGGKVEQVTKGERRLGNVTIDKSFRTIAYTVGLHESPGDVYAADIDGTHERRLTDIHKAFTTDVALSRAERLKWPSNDGTLIEGWLMFPYNYDAQKRYPMIVMSHGGPHAATGYSFDFKKQYFAANGYFVFDTNFRSSTGYGDAFKWATWGEWGNKDGQDVVSGIDYVLKRYPIDPGRVGHTGHSYGGFMTNWLITQYPERFAAAVTGAGISNWTSDYGNADIYRTKETEFFGTPWDKDARDRMIKQSPLSHAGNVKTPTLFIHGEVDHRVPFEEGLQMYFALRRRGVPAKIIQYAGQPHGIAGNWNVVHRMINELKWWEKYLKPAPAKTTSPNAAR